MVRGPGAPYHAAMQISGRRQMQMLAILDEIERFARQLGELAGSAANIQAHAMALREMASPGKQAESAEILAGAVLHHRLMPPEEAGYGRIRIEECVWRMRTVLVADWSRLGRAEN